MVIRFEMIAELKLDAVTVLAVTAFSDNRLGVDLDATRIFLVCNEQA